MYNSKIAIVIPSRIGSVRLPKKPLEIIGEYTMIEHVVHRAIESGVGDVFVATDSNMIADKATKAGAKAIMVIEDVATGTDRVWEAVKEIEKSQEVEYVINLQGDLPLVSPKIISTIAEALLTTDADIITPVTKDPAEKVNNPARVKVIRGINDEALYFSRNMIPYGSDYYWHHIGIYGFKRDSLERFVKMPQSHTELSEKLEQLRALHNGMKIGLCDAVENVASVDTAEDLQFVRNLYHKLHQIV